MDFAHLKKNLNLDYSGLRRIKVALLGDSATQLLSQALRGYGYEAGLDLELYEADYNQIRAQIFNKGSDLYKFSPDVVVIFRSVQHISREFYTRPESQKTSFAETHLQEASTIYQAVMESASSGIVIYFNLCENDDGVFGNYANKVDASFLWQLRQINFGLMSRARQLKNLYICDLSALQNRYGSEFIFDPRLYVNADMVTSLDALPVIARNVTDIIQAVKGTFKKCLILDLDNTVWGGVIGDDGMEHIQVGDLGIGKAFTELQLWAKQLQQRGILLAACSKNDEATAMQPFKDHPDMVLRLEDFSVFVANWNNKVDNIRQIQKTLNIGLDAMVFLDDNVFERNLVREHMPDLCVPELPQDPADYMTYLRGLNLFEAASFTEEDAQRTRQYQQEAKRVTYQSAFANEADYLASLEMTSAVKPFDDYTIPRVAQLTQRSNQFNLRTVRYTEDELKKMALSSDYLAFSFTLQDKFGDNGLISVVILKKQGRALFIDTWLMSCRVLGRGMQEFVLNELVAAARQDHFEELLGEYIPTTKNKMVKDHYLSLGFRAKGNHWSLDAAGYAMKNVSIKKEGAYLPV